MSTRRAAALEEHVVRWEKRRLLFVRWERVQLAQQLKAALQLTSRGDGLHRCAKYLWSAVRMALSLCEYCGHH